MKYRKIWYNKQTKAKKFGSPRFAAAGEGNMDVTDSNRVDGTLRISTGVIVKIAKLAALEIEGVQSVSVGTMGMHGLIHRMKLEKPVLVQFTEGVAEITVFIIVRYGCRVPPLCEKLQENVKSSVQNMTGITVSKVNIVVAGVALSQTEQPA